MTDDIQAWPPPKTPLPDFSFRKATDDEIRYLGRNEILDDIQFLGDVNQGERDLADLKRWAKDRMREAEERVTERSARSLAHCLNHDLYGWICPKCDIGVRPDETTCPKCEGEK